MDKTWVPGTVIPELKESNLLAQGGHAKIYLIGEHFVVRRLKEFQGHYPNADLIAYLNEKNFPTAMLHEVRNDMLVMERLHGPTLLQELLAQEISLAEGVRIIAQFHNKLRALTTPDFELSQGAAKPDHAVLHMDIHPGTIVITQAGPRLVDWEDARFGPPQLDIASTALIFAMLASSPGELQAGSASMFRKFSRQVGSEFVPFLEEAALIRATQLQDSTEEKELIAPGLEWAMDHLDSFNEWCVPTRPESTQ